ncbi:MAG: glycerophosphodiester phosphodiesterase [Bacteroidota bacterium]
MKQLFSILGLGLLLTACVPKQETIAVNPYRLSKGQAPWIIAHGGAKQLFPENTMLAFRGSAEIGVDALEMDVTMTKDEVLVTHHDLTIDRMSDGEGRVIDFTYEELLAYNFGHDFEDLQGNRPYESEAVPIAKLEEVITSFPDHPLMIELKDRGEDGKRAAVVLQAMIEEYALKDRVVVVAFSEEVLNYFQGITKGEILIGTSQEASEDFVFSGLSAMEFLHQPEAAVVAIPTSSAGINLASRRIINSAHRRNMAVQYWTINDKETMKSLLEKGADGLITDRPDLMREVLEEMGW